MQIVRQTKIVEPKLYYYALARVDYSRVAKIEYRKRAFFFVGAASKHYFSCRSTVHIHHDKPESHEGQIVIINARATTEVARFA